MSRWRGLVGQERAVAAVRRAVSGQRPHHAWLLLGPAGAGKMTLAMTLAAGLVCEADDRPCGECLGCRKVANGTHPDIWTEVPGGKSNTITVDQVTEIQRRLGYRRAEGNFRVVMIDGAGTMNAQSQNKLLKTLEEPPPATVLVLCALHPGQLLVTVRSRCSKLALGSADPEEVASWLVETRGADPALAADAAHAAHGLPGLACTLLDPEVITARRETTAALVAAIGGDRAAIDAITAEVGWDREAGAMTLSLLQELLRDAMVAQTGAQLAPLHPTETPLAGRLLPLSPEHLADLVGRVEAAREKLSRNVTPGGLIEDLLVHLSVGAPRP